MEQVAAPQQLAAKETIYKFSLSKVDLRRREKTHLGNSDNRTVPMLGTASSGRDKRAPILAERSATSGVSYSEAFSGRNRGLKR